MSGKDIIGTVERITIAIDPNFIQPTIVVEMDTTNGEDFDVLTPKQAMKLIDCILQAVDKVVEAAP
jgi:hypothetical protein